MARNVNSCHFEETASSKFTCSWFLFAWHMHTYSSLFEQGTRTGNSQYDILGANLSIFERKIHVGKGLEDKTKKILTQETGKQKLAGN